MTEPTELIVLARLSASFFVPSGSSVNCEDWEDANQQSWCLLRLSSMEKPKHPTTTLRQNRAVNFN
ncbi:hypothetical protein [Burkholderia latens]|uniref:Uncharacterized protein n=1 Tax=Burkholderia latens TaxID=488446 RepID=A0A6H9T6T4_9BURK|nr:hypothetical protein [Burkholderia latens]KAB0644841.1 hypothetical protein F7R21_00615 [Burkholderia latens]